MDSAIKLVVALKENNKSHFGYGLQKESEALIHHILENMVKSNLPPFKSERKNEKDSIRHREEGNQKFVSGDDIDAIESYTKSLAYADTPELMAYAFANRSAALYRKEFYKECLMDIDAALQLGYPVEKRKKLEERAARAMIESASKAAKKEGSSEKCPFQSKTESEAEKKFPLICGVIKEETESKEASEILKNSNYLAQDGPPKLAHGPSKEAPSASDGIEIRFSPEFGRHLVAVKKFKPGDVMAVEDPFATVLYQERYYTHCHHCLSRCYNLVPCPRCPMAQYCSEKCKKAAWNLTHRIECRIISLLPSLLNVDKDKIRMLTKIMRLLVIVTKNGTTIEELRRDMKVAESNTDSRTAGFTDAGTLDSYSGRSALSLATNMTTRPLIGISAFACISSLVAMLLAVETTFFKKKYDVEELRDTSKLPDITFAGAVMLRACVIMSSNCFSIQQEPGIKSASGLYVLHSLHNHSCAPNTFRHFEDCTMITRALQPIAPGDQIFTCYGADHAYLPRLERQKKLLEEYFFECRCRACEGDWPTYKEILQQHVGSISKRKELVQKLKPLKERLLKNKHDVGAVQKVLEILEADATRPCEEIVHASQFLKSYYLGLEPSCW